LRALARRPVDPTTAEPDLEEAEELLVVLRGIGATMFLTTDRVILARDAVQRRPRSGIQSFPLTSILHLRVELGNGPSGRIAVWATTGQEAVSMFFDAHSLDRAHELIDAARPLIARLRRERAGDAEGPPPGPRTTG
jgi:hypothetical protein